MPRVFMDLNYQTIMEGMVQTKSKMKKNHHLSFSN